ncbi:hypothetical protein WKH40_22900, partial [Pantoea agglomerans]
GCGERSGLVQAMRDPRLSQAIAAMHREPGENWTVARLASVAGRTMQDIVSQVQNVTALIAQISAATAEQATALSEVSSAVED